MILEKNMLKEKARIWIITFLFIALVAGISSVELVRSYDSLIHVVYTEADLSGFLVSEWIKKSLDGIRAILKDSLFNLNETNILSSSVNEPERTARNNSLIHKAEQYDDIIFLGIFDPECVIQYGSISSIIGDSSKELDRDYCNDVQADPVDRLKISDLFVSATGEVNVSVTYPLLSAENRLIGFALAGLDLSFFQTWLDSIENPAVTISIIDMNQVLLARTPESDEIGGRIVDTELEKFVQSGSESNTFRRKSPVDGIERLWSLRKTGDLPFIVAVGYELDDVLGPWRTKLYSYIIGNILLFIMTAFFASAYQKNRVNAKTMEKLAMHDLLTGLMNRRSFNTVADMRFGEARKNGRADSVVIIDIDFFKKINDRHGHDAGDMALKEVADFIRTNFRSTDLVCRWGGEEFVVYLVDTDKDTAGMLAERLRQRIETGLTRSGYPVTVSQGIASSGEHGSYDQMLKTADERLYRAKAAGRNRVCAE
jgi:diguanylate cyclase (GGDEF)-like protein